MIDPPQLELKSSYGGFSAATETQGIRVVIHVPPEQVKGIMKVVQIVTHRGE